MKSEACAIPPLPPYIPPSPITPTPHKRLRMKSWEINRDIYYCAQTSRPLSQAWRSEYNDLIQAIRNRHVLLCCVQLAPLLNSATLYRVPPHWTINCIKISINYSKIKALIVLLHAAVSLRNTLQHWRGAKVSFHTKSTLPKKHATSTLQCQPRYTVRTFEFSHTNNLCAPYVSE
jgi:hypothetical protein